MRSISLCQYTMPWLSLWESCHQQVTERTLRPRDVICLRRCQHFPIGRCRYLPSPSSLRSATSPTGEARECQDGNRTRPSDFRAARALRGRPSEWSVSIQIRSICANIRCLGSPFGELSPQSDALRPRDVICLRRCQHFPIGRCRYLPSPSSLRSATSPTGRGKGVPGRKPFYDHPTFGRHAH